MTLEIRERIGQRGPANPMFKGGYWQIGSRSPKRYFLVWLSPEERAAHPTVKPKGYINRSHLVWNEAHPDDPVLPGQVIHHINEDSEDDRIENLEKMASQAEHAQHHFSRPRGPMSDEHKRAVSEGKRRAAAAKS